MQTIAICNHKGGSAKTTTTYYLGTLLAEAGLRTLLVDLDAQANLSGRFFYETEYTVADALGGRHAAPRDVERGDRPRGRRERDRPPPVPGAV